MGPNICEKIASGVLAGQVLGHLVLVKVLGCWLPYM